MKKVASILIVVLSLNLVAQESQNVDYKKGTIDILEKSLEALENEVANLSEQQLKFKPKDGGWSIMNNLEHLSVVEALLVGRMTQMINDNNVDDNKDLSANDWLVIAQVSDRANKVVTPPPFRPKAEKAHMTKDDFLAEIKEKRMALIELIKSTDVNLRKVFGPYPYGEVDGIQSCMVIGAHCFRHTVQIKEILKEQSELSAND